MIRYPITQNQLETLIEEEVPNWLHRAQQRTETFRQAQRYNERSGIWSEIKAVYIKLQESKCAYCERKLEGPEFGKIEHDVEHYRPKNPVKKWPTRKIGRERNINYPYSTGNEWEEGYYLLAYCVLNYVTACKTCNTPLKSSYFPVAGPRGPQSQNPRNLRSEKPYLIYPLSNIDKDPEDLIGFYGVLPIAKKRRGHDHRRAVVTIDFFELDTRETLLHGRAWQINQIWLAIRLKTDAPSPDNIELASKTIRTVLSSSSPYTACSRAFYKLYKEDPQKAEEVYNQLDRYLNGSQ